MNIAIVGTGIAGLTCAHYLYRDHDITLFEQGQTPGGHVATVDVEVDSGRYAIDTGFIVFNNRTYPNFERLLADIGVRGQPTEMSFSVCNQAHGLEYNGHSLGSLFAQKSNLVNWRFYRFLGEILRFNRLARAAARRPAGDSTLSDFLDQHGFSDYFCENYVLPMGAAIWSSSMADIRDFPLVFFVNFFNNHGLLDISNRPQWSVIPGGSREYVKALIAPFADRIRLQSPVTDVVRHSQHVELTTPGGREIFDQVIFACHSNQALAALRQPSADELLILDAIRYQDNDVVLHTDTQLLPENPAAWAAWNYHLGVDTDNARKQPALTYNMNILQGLSAPEVFCVTLNQDSRIDPAKVLRRFTYAHPVFNRASLDAQLRRSQINGKQRTWFCGAYWYNGFHEDGVRSALDVIEGLRGATYA